MAVDSLSALAGVRILDLARRSAGAVARDLGLLGADVIRVAPPGDEDVGAAGAQVTRSDIQFAATNPGKRSMGLDFANAADRAQLDMLIADADILVESFGPDGIAGFDAADIAMRFPNLVVLSLSDFGRTGPLAAWRGNSALFHALSGELSRSGIPGRPPLLPPGDLAVDCALAQATWVALTAYFNRLRTGIGDHVDFSLLDGAAMALDPGMGMGGSATAGVPASKLPRGRPEARHMYPILPCADGHVRICVLAPRQWQGMFEWMGRPEALADPELNKLHVRFRTPTLIPAIAGFFADKTRAQLEAEGQRHGVPTASVLSLDEAIASEQMLARHAFAEREVAPGVFAPFPNGVLEIDGVRAGPGDAVPTNEAGALRWMPRPEPARTAPALAARPLSGLRVLDLGVIVVGAETGRLFADQGADVIKVENAAFPDGSRQSANNVLMSVGFASGHRNKRSIGLNLRAAEGKALFLKLVAQSDVVLSNFKPGTLDSLGLSPAALSAANPRIVMVDSSAFGPTGPWSRLLGYGPLVRASTGLTNLWRYPGEPDGFCDAITVYPDHVAARYGAIGALALLIRRLRTDAGGSVSVSQAEVMMSHFGPIVAEGALARAGHAIQEEPERDAPWGVFECAGDDDWCVVTVGANSEWKSLCSVLGRHDLASDPELASRIGRDAARERIDSALTDWLSRRSSREAMEMLQAAGVPAAAMLRVFEMPEFEYYREREVYAEIHHPHIDTPFVNETAPARSKRMPAPELGPAPLAGEHSVEIMGTLLGLDSEEIERLIEAKILDVAENSPLATGTAA